MTNIPDLRSEICKSCIHTKICFHDKNICGDRFVPGNPMIFDNSELYRKYEEKKAKGFPCNDYFPEIVRCGECKHRMIASSEEGTHYYYCAKHDHAIDTDWFCADGEKVTE